MLSLGKRIAIKCTRPSLRPLSSSITGGSLPDGFNAEQWSWVPPKSSSASSSTSTSSSSEVIPVISGKLLTVGEIGHALNKGGAEDVVILPLNGKLDTISNFVIASGRSRLHLKRLGSVIVQALKKRNLTQAPSISGYEGQNDDDWVLVDCYDTVVHLLLPTTRQAIKLEQHWSMKERPFLVESAKEDLEDERMERLIDQYPVEVELLSKIENEGGVKISLGLVDEQKPWIYQLDQDSEVAINAQVKNQSPGVK